MRQFLDRLYCFSFFLMIVLSPDLFSISASPSRAPWGSFVSGDAFRAHCDYVFDETDASLDPAAVRPYSAIFVKGDYLGKFFHAIHPHLSHPYILVTHNSDESAPGGFSRFLQDGKLIAWFAQNVDDSSHPKMHPIPIGVANRCWKHGNGDAIDHVRAQKLQKRHLLYLNIAVATYPRERETVHRLLNGARFVYSAKPKPFEEYLTDLASCAFVAAPRGNGLDTHRFWESIYLGSYPIVKTSALDPLYEDLPVVIVQDWNEVTEEFLLRKRKELSAKSYNLNKLSMSYWTQLIDSYKK